MEQHGTALAPLAELDDLRPLVAGLGPFLSAHLPLVPATEEVAEASALRWRAAREGAAAAGAPEPMLAVVDNELGGAHRWGTGLSVVVAADGDTHVSHLPVPPPFELVRWEPVPSLTPLIAARQRLQPHVVALVDRVGADLVARRPGGGRGDADDDVVSRAVDGEDHPISKVAPGGWSQRRFQQRAEETWHRNMSDVAAELATLAERSGARVVALGGDQRAVGLVSELLPVATRDLLRPIAATRAADGSTDHLDEEVAAAVEAWTDEQLARTLSLYRQELGQQDRATAGALETLDALREARVGVLLVRLVGNDDRRAWVGGSPDLVAATPEALTGDGEPRSAPLIDASVAAALATGADVRVVADDDELPEGLGALLRW
jgi:hypothetical protein